MTEQPTLGAPSRSAPAHDASPVAGRLAKWREWAPLATLGVILTALLVAALVWRFNAGPLNTTAMEQAQIARNVSEGRSLSTYVVRPFAVPNSPGTPDFVPEMLHEPLYPLLASVAFVLGNPSDRTLIALSLALWVVSTALMWVLALRLGDGNRLYALIATTIFAFSPLVLGGAVAATGALLTTLLLLALLLTLTPRPVVEAAEGTKKRKKRKVLSPEALLDRRLFMAGALAALCYLSDYISLLYVVPIVLIWGHSLTTWNARSLSRLAMGFTLVALPWWIRNFRLTGNPFATLQWFELVTNTNKFPGDSLWRDALAGRDASLFSLGVGPGDLIRKLGRGIATWIAQLPTALNPFVAPFVLLFFVVRAPFSRLEGVNVGRVLLVVLPLYLLGLSAFGRTELLHLVPLVPLFALVGASGVQSAFAMWGQAWRSRHDATDRGSLARSQMRAFGRTKAALGLGLAVLLLVPLAPLAGAIAARQNPIPEAQKTRQHALGQLGETLEPKRALVSDAPAELAWRANRKTIWAPMTVEGLNAIEKQHPVGALFLTANVSRGDDVWREVFSGSRQLPQYSQEFLTQNNDAVWSRTPEMPELEKRVRANPKDLRSLTALGYLRLEAGQPEKGLQTFRQAQKVAPNQTEGFLGAGAASLALRDYESAERFFGRALQLAPRSLTAQMGLGDAALARGQGEKAIQIYERVLADFPDYTIAINNLAFLYAERGTERDLGLALHMARRAAQNDPKNPQMRDTLGWVAFQTGRIEEAVAHLGEAARLAPNDGLINYHFGRALVVAKRPADAVQALQKAVDQPSLPAAERSQARALLARLRERDV